LRAIRRTAGLYPGRPLPYDPTREPARPFETDFPMTDAETIKHRIAELHLEHRGLDAMIDALGQQPRFDELQLRRLKKRKLQIKDAITLLQMQLIPDIPA
jgi:hypothetical protein